MSSTADSTDVHTLEFEQEKDGPSTSWKRARPKEALIESFGRFGYKVTLRDGEEVHYCALGLEGGEYIGRCDCNGWKYHDGPCAHLCTLRKADFIGEIDVEAADGTPEDEHQMHQATGETFDGNPHDTAVEQAREVRP